jgi:hypothetical protein
LHLNLQLDEACRRTAAEAPTRGYAKGKAECSPALCEVQAEGWEANGCLCADAARQGILAGFEKAQVNSDHAAASTFNCTADVAGSVGFVIRSNA